MAGYTAQDAKVMASCPARCQPLEARTGVEPVYKDLQSSA